MVDIPRFPILYMMFRDRSDAGKRLAEILSGFKGSNSVIYALPRGGVPVGYEISVKLGIPLDVLIVKKIGAPYQEELAVGAVAEGTPPAFYFNREILYYTGMDEQTAKEYAGKKIKEIEELKEFYRRGETFSVNPDTTAILVDDGVATGATMKVAVEFFKEHGYKRVVVAVPVAQNSVLREIRSMADEVYCVQPVDSMYAVGEFYQNFREITHEQAREMLLNARQILESSG